MTISLLASVFSLRSSVIRSSNRRLCLNAAAKVILEKGKARLFQDGNPLIYGGAVKEVVGDPEPGAEVNVEDHMGNLLGRGVFNPFSQYRVRMLARSHDPAFAMPFEELLKVRIEQATVLRRAVGLPSAENTVYRLINGEGDRLGGLVVDVMAGTIVAQSSALWVERHRAAIELAISSSIASDRFVWRRAESRLKQDGYTGEMMDIISSAKPTTATSSSSAAAAAVEDVIVIENGIKYYVSPEDGQKTGFYADQRDNRQKIRSLCHGKTVLDTFCYSGGFSLNAALGGAVQVTAVDSSKPALDTANKNTILNGVENIVTTVKADAIEYMKKMLADGQTYDVVICDPPKLAPTRTSLDKAKSKYAKINSLAMQLVKPGGVLLTCTCSAAMAQSEDFRYMLLDSAKQAKRDLTVLSTTGTRGMFFA